MILFTLEYKAWIVKNPSPTHPTRYPYPVQSTQPEWIHGTMTVEAETEAAARVKATSAIRNRFRSYGMKISLKVLNQQDVI